MPKYEARRCETPNHEKWCVCVDGVPGPAFDTEGQAITEAERLQMSWDALVEWVKEQAGVLREANTENSRHIGSVRQADELHALQSQGRSEFTIHLQAALSQPLTVGQEADITYYNGHGTVDMKQKHERGNSRDGR